MKQYETPTIIMRLKGQEDLLAISDKVTLAIKCDKGEVHTFDGARLVIDGDQVELTLTEEETADMLGVCKVELTMETGDKVFKTKTRTMTIHEAVWEGPND